MKFAYCLAVMSLVAQPIGLVGVASDAQGARLSQQSPDSSLSQEITPLMQKWRKAVLTQDPPGLVRFALPKYRQPVSTALRDRRSLLWRSVFGETGSYRALLQDSRTQLRVFERHVFEGDHTYATGCFFKGEFEWPTHHLALYELSKRRDVRCLDWLFAKGEENEWFISYDFGIPEGRVVR